MAAKPYDPINSIEGMFNGCITRIAQAIKDPVNFGPSTKGVLLECSKRFQDALDDCEIQILDAKFYLEQQLAQNKVRREAKAKEETVASAKRKHDEIRDKDTEGQVENAKRVKLEDSKLAEPEQPLKPPQAPDSEKKDAPTDQKPAPPNPKATTTPIPQPKESEAPKPPDKSSKDDKTKTKDKDKDKPPDDPPAPLTTPLDEFPKATPNATPAPTNDDFNFESMFGEPSADITNSADLTFDLDLGALDPSGMGNLDTNNDPTQDQDADLTSLLPGLESYANQASDDPSGLAVGMADQSGGGMNFGLPNLEPNEFDAFLDANDFGAGGVGAGDGGFKMDDAMNMNPESMENVDFDSMFN